eukprot:jgi/Ulvmu1/11362/UM075_0022.1
MDTSPRELLRTVRPEMKIDEVALLRYLKQTNLVDVRTPALEISQFGHGQSNPTYLVKAGSQEMVLRKQPPGKLLASAHAVGREFRVMRALAPTPVPVPRMINLCTEPSVIGTEFYLMSFVDGVLCRDPTLPQHTPRSRETIYRHMAKTLAQIHALDPAAVGLESFGKPAGFCARQVSVWSKQYLRCTAPGTGNERLEVMPRLAAWLRAHAPAADASAGTPRVVHGDLRLDNLILHPQRHSVSAVLDWELATLGNPLSDLGINCSVYHLPEEVTVVGRLGGQLPDGVPHEHTFVAWYCEARGIQVPPAADWAFYVALALFRAAAIFAGVHTRALSGIASSSAAHSAGAPYIIRAVAEAALRVVDAAPGTPFAAVAAHSGAAAPAPAAVPPDATAVADTTSLTPGTPAVPPTPPGLSPSAACAPLLAQLRTFMSERIAAAAPAFDAHAHSSTRWDPFPGMATLRTAAQAAGLWNLWIPAELRMRIDAVLAAADTPPRRAALLRGPGLSNLDYAFLAREMGAVPWCPEVFNCSAPDTGNMEVLARYGSRQQQHRWLLPLLAGDVRSCFAMTEPDVASSDATNVQGSITRAGDEYIVHGRKWWISGACDSRCAVAIFMGKTDVTAPKHAQQSMILVPMAARGVSIKRPMTVFGEDDAPHGHAEMEFNQVRVPADSIILGEGRGFEIAQGRLGPGRLHHCMRACGIGHTALRLAAERVQERQTFGQALHRSPLVQAQLAEAWLTLHSAWLAVLHAAHRLDEVGNKAARLEITAAKVLTPKAVLAALDTAVQLHGAAGVGQDTPLAALYGATRTLRIADGPDEVHLMAIGAQVIKRAALSKL